MPGSLNQLRRAELQSSNLFACAVSPSLWRWSRIHRANPMLGKDLEPGAWEFVDRQVCRQCCMPENIQ